MANLWKAFLALWVNPSFIRPFRWLLFTVVFGLVPLAGAFFHRLFSGQPAPLSKLVEHGELLIVSAALAADALGDLIASDKDWLAIKLFAGGGCAILLALASVLFADVSFNQAVAPDIVLRTSVWIFVFTLVSSGSCKVLAKS